MSESKQNPFILVDGSSYLFRAYHALPPLTNSKGMPTGAVYGVINMLRRLIKDYSPYYMAVIFDPKGPTFRKDLYPAYKANRDAMPDELQIQIAPLHNTISALGLPLIIVDGVEADDVIATLAKRAKAAGLQTVVSTGDKDLAQIVDEDITLINTMSNKTLDIEGIKQKFGVEPQQIIDYLTLMGDTSDNIPGVLKVGPKTAAKWLNTYKTLDSLIEHADDIKGKVGENLRQQIDQLPLSRTLVTVKTDVALSQQPKELILTEPQQDKLIDLFTELEFKTWLTEIITKKSNSEETKAQTHYDTVLTQQQLDHWFTELKSNHRFALDTETTALNPIDASLVGISLSHQAHHAAYIPLTHDYIDAPQQLDKQQVLKQLQSLLSNPNNTIIGQNLKYDCHILANEDINISEIKAQLWDSMLASYVLDSSTTRHDLDTLALKYCQHINTKFEDVAGKGKKQLRFNQIPLEQASPYAAEDADIAYRLYDVLNANIENTEGLHQVLYDIELPLMPILTKMERYGVLINTNMLNQQSQSLAKHIKQLEAEVHTIAGETFNLSSPKQLQTILYNTLKLPVLKKTPTGQPSTAEPVLQELAAEQPIAKLILEYRSLSKLKSTYTDKLPKQINPKTGRVHTSYNQTGTITGRLSSKDPNLQNIPVRTEQGRKIRQAFIAPPGYRIVSADYSQVELRIMAHLSQDPGLLSAFASDQDIHSSTAAEVFNVDISNVTADQRRHAKAINFGLMYGMSSYGLSQQLDISRKQAQEYIDLYFHRYPKVHDYMEQARETAKAQGYVTTLYGRRVAVADINASNKQRRAAAERAAINAPLQGSAADIIKLAMLCVDQWLTTTDLDTQMIMQVHDELVFEVKEDLIDDACEHIRQCMEGVIELSVPLLVDIGIGDNWDQAH